MTLPSTLSCLVVDDDPSLREILAVNLEYEGMCVYVAADGDEGEALAHRAKPDVILLDVMMPGRDGYAVLAALKASPDTREIPVVLLTAKAMAHEISQGWAAGADHYITKPFSIDELIHYFNTISPENCHPDIAA